jgi:hypothetical protein
MQAIGALRQLQQINPFYRRAPAAWVARRAGRGGRCWWPGEWLAAWR